VKARMIGLAMGLILSGFVQTLAQQPEQKPLPDDVGALMTEVHTHQMKLEQVRENYTYTSAQLTEDLDGHGQVKKTVQVEDVCFFVHGHAICRMVRKDGRPLSAHEADRETERITRQVEKAEKTPPDQPLEGPTIRVSRLLNIMDVSCLRRQSFRGRETLVFDFSGRKEAKTSGTVEGASKKLKGTIWVDEKDLVISRVEVRFTENFSIGGGLVANVQKGSNFSFDQAPVNGEIWLPTGAEGDWQVRVLLFKGVRQHFVERDFDYQRFHVSTDQEKSVTVAPGRGARPAKP